MSIDKKNKVEQLAGTGEEKSRVEIFPSPPAPPPYPCPSLPLLVLIFIFRELRSSNRPAR
jgi:hypothetical protein